MKPLRIPSTTMSTSTSSSISSLLSTLLLFLLITLPHHQTTAQSFYKQKLLPNLLDLRDSPFETFNGSESKALPSCARDCAPIFTANSFCMGRNPGSSSSKSKDRLSSKDDLYRCFCSSPYLKPLFTTGEQCAYMCGRHSRKLIIEWLLHPSICGSRSPLSDRVGKDGKTTVKDRLPRPESFTRQPTDVEYWWNQWRDGEKFGILLGIILAFLFVCYAVWKWFPSVWWNYARGVGGFWMWRVGRRVKGVFKKDGE